MAYQLAFFCRAGADSGQDAMSQLLDAVLETGGLLTAEVLSPLFQDSVAVYKLRSRSDPSVPSADWLTLEVHVGIGEIADSVIAASPNDEQGIWGSDLLAMITLIGEAPDWPLVNRIWGAVGRLWGAVPWDEASGFEIANSAPSA